MPVRTDGLGIIDCGDYSAIREYSILNLVTEGGSSYICRKAPCLGKPLPVLPNNRTEYWVLAARKGSDVQMRVTDSAVQWCVAGQDWADLIQLSDMTEASVLAVEKAAEAVAAKDAAVLAKEAAESAQTGANTSATNASNSATAALNARNATISAKDLAELAAGNAEEHAGIASAAKTGALNAQTAAETAKTGAETAKTGAETAKACAEAAQTAAETALSETVTVKNAAQSAKTAAETARDAATAEKEAAVIARGGAETARSEAQALVGSVTGMTASAKTLVVGSQATAEVEMSGGLLNVEIGVPTGATGATGFSPTVSVSKTGKVTTVNITDSGGTKTATINDGADGLGSGNMHTDIYDTNDDGTVDRADVADALDTNATVTMGQVTGLAAALSGKSNTGHTHTASDVGAVPTTRTVNSKALSSDIALTASDVGAATVATYTATIPATGWTGSAAPYTKDITVAGVLETDAPIIDIVQTGTWATDETMREDWNKITRITTAAGQITAYASEVPSAAIAIQMKVVR